MKIHFTINSKSQLPTTVSLILLIFIFLSVISCTTHKGVRKRNKSIQQWETRHQPSDSMGITVSTKKPNHSTKK